MNFCRTRLLTLLGFLLLLRMSSIIESDQRQPTLDERKLSPMRVRKQVHHSNSNERSHRSLSPHHVHHHHRYLQDDPESEYQGQAEGDRNQGEGEGDGQMDGENEPQDNESDYEQPGYGEDSEQANGDYESLDQEDQGQSEGEPGEDEMEPEEEPKEEGMEVNEVITPVPHIEFQDYSQMEHLMNYKKISDDMQFYENEYSLCIKEIKEDNYTEESLDECLGKNFIKVSLDLKYIIMKVMAKADERIRKVFISDCYGPAGLVQEFSNSCDLMERDILDLLWNGMDFLGIIDLNKAKYLTEYGLLPEAHYSKIYGQLAPLSKEIFELLDELDSHKEITILRLKTLIDDRTKLILEEAQNHPSMVQPAVVQHRIEITENLVSDEGEGINFLPVEQFRHEIMRKKDRELGQKDGNQEGREKENSLRVMNSDNEYRELNGSNREIATVPRNKVDKNHQSNSSFVSRLGKESRLQSSSPFKNIHTEHYSKFAKMR